MKAGKYTTSFLGTSYPIIFIDTEVEATKYISRLMSQSIPLYGIDTETYAYDKYKYISKAALSPHLSGVRLLQIFTGKTALVFDILKIGNTKIFTEFLSTNRFIGHNSIFDLQYFLKDFSVKSMNIGCTYLASKLLFHALKPTDEGLSASLKNVVNMAFQEEIYKELQLSDWSVLDLNFEQIEYAALDAISVYFLSLKLKNKIKAQGLYRVYDLYKQAQTPLARLQLNGIKLDVSAHRDMVVTWRAESYAAKKALLALTELDDITSTTIAKYLYKSLPQDVLNIWPRTETGKLATDSNVFADFDFVDIVKPFAKFQRLSKLCTSFGSSLIESVNPETGRLHAQYKLAGARTGRLSCSSPNLQQLPRSKEVRKNFITESGNSFLCADYSQIEIRVGAEISRDAVMLDAYQKGIDLHSLTASLISHKVLTDVTKEDRQKAKAFNFGLMFGLGAKKFSHYAKKSYGAEVSLDEAKHGVDTFRKTYFGYRDWQIRTTREAAEKGFVTTICGKKRCLDPENSYGPSLNTPVQGSAGECLLYSLIHLDNYLTKTNSNAKLVNVVHDEVNVECPESEKLEVTNAIKTSMVEGFLDVFPNGVTNGLVEVTGGSTWADK